MIGPEVFAFAHTENMFIPYMVFSTTKLSLSWCIGLSKKNKHGFCSIVEFHIEQTQEIAFSYAFRLQTGQQFLLPFLEII